jgi:hypothetical protein
MYSFSYGSLRFFFFGAVEGSAGPKSSSSEEESSAQVSYFARELQRVCEPSSAFTTGSFISWSCASISARERFVLLGDSDPLEAMAAEVLCGGAGGTAPPRCSKSSRSSEAARSRRPLTCHFEKSIKVIGQSRSLHESHRSKHLVRTHAGMVLVSECKTPLQCKKVAFTPGLPHLPPRSDEGLSLGPQKRRYRS